MHKTIVLALALAGLASVSTPDRASAGLFCCQRPWYGSPCAVPGYACGTPYYWVGPSHCWRPHHHCGLFSWLFHCHRSCGASSCNGFGYECDGCGDGSFDSCGDGCVGGCVGGDGCGAGCSDGGGFDSGYTTEGYSGDEGYSTDLNGSESEIPGKVIYDGPAAGAPTIAPDANVPEAAAPEAAPPEEESIPAGDATGLSRPTHQLTSFRNTRSPRFEKGLNMYREGNLNAAVNEFEAAAEAEPANALYLYHQALVQFDLNGADSAQEALNKAIRAERKTPVENWGRQMERIQGQGRLWIEKARRDAGLVR